MNWTDKQCDALLYEVDMSLRLYNLLVSYFKKIGYSDIRLLKISDLLYIDLNHFQKNKHINKHTFNELIYFCELAKIQKSKVMQINELEKKVHAWAINKKICFKDNSLKQLLKTVEELGELSSSLIKNDIDGIKDGIGDVIVTLIILARANDTNINECLQIAWDEIKDRTGETVNGIFIKNQP